jgi:hypothetical protein
VPTRADEGPALAKMGGSLHPSRVGASTQQQPDKRQQAGHQADVNQRQPERGSTAAHRAALPIHRTGRARLAGRCFHRRVRAFDDPALHSPPGGGRWLSGGGRRSDAPSPFESVSLRLFRFSGRPVLRCDRHVQDDDAGPLRRGRVERSAIYFDVGVLVDHMHHPSP